MGAWRRFWSWIWFFSRVATVLRSSQTKSQAITSGYSKIISRNTYLEYSNTWSKYQSIHPAQTEACAASFSIIFFSFSIIFFICRKICTYDVYHMYMICNISCYKVTSSCNEMFTDVKLEHLKLPLSNFFLLNAL